MARYAERQTCQDPAEAERRINRIILLVLGVMLVMAAIAAAIV